MKKLLLVTLTITLIWGCKEESKETAPSIADNMKTYTIEQMMDNEAISGARFSPDKSKLLISSNRSGIYNMYTVPTAGGPMEPVTLSDSTSIFAISFFPKDERMLFRTDGNGGEIYHIYLRDTDGSQKDLTPPEGARPSFYGYARKDTHLSAPRSPFSYSLAWPWPGREGRCSYSYYQVNHGMQARRISDGFSPNRLKIGCFHG